MSSSAPGRSQADAPARADEVVVSLRGVTKVFTPPGAPSVEVLRGIDLDVHAGERIALLGRSGSGKSTLLNIVGLLDSPTSGTYELRGVDVASFTERARDEARRDAIGFVFQTFHLIHHLDVLHNIAVPLQIVGLPRGERLRRAWEAAQVVGLEHRLRADCRTLSGGEAQRVAIARALVGRPSVLLCDEPTGSLDSRTGAGVLRLISDAAEAGCAVVIVTHDDEVAGVADRRVRIDDGALR